MNQRLANWASIAEIASGIAVVVTLIVLILGVQENTLVTRASAYDRNIDALNSIRMDIVGDSEIARRWLAFETGDASELDDVERLQLEFHVGAVFQLYEKAYFNHEYGVLGNAEWTRYDRQICIQWDRLDEFPDFETNLEEVLTDEFWEYVVALCGTDN